MSDPWPNRPTLRASVLRLVFAAVLAVIGLAAPFDKPPAFWIIFAMVILTAGLPVWRLWRARRVSGTDADTTDTEPR